MRFEEVYKKLEKEAIDPRRSDGRYARKRRIVYIFSIHRNTERAFRMESCRQFLQVLIFLLCDADDFIYGCYPPTDLLKTGFP